MLARVASVRVGPAVARHPSVTVPPLPPPPLPQVMDGFTVQDTLLIKAQVQVIRCARSRAVGAAGGVGGWGGVPQCSTHVDRGGGRGGAGSVCLGGGGR